MSLRDNLIANDKATFGESYQAHYLEIYKLYVQMADNISARRQSANSFFLGVPDSNNVTLCVATQL